MKIEIWSNFVRLQVTGVKGRRFSEIQPPCSNPPLNVRSGVVFERLVTAWRDRHHSLGRASKPSATPSSSLKAAGQGKKKLSDRAQNLYTGSGHYKYARHNLFLSWVNFEQSYWTFKKSIWFQFDLKKYKSDRKVRCRFVEGVTRSSESCMRKVRATTFKGAVSSSRLG